MWKWWKGLWLADLLRAWLGKSWPVCQLLLFAWLLTRGSPTPICWQFLYSPEKSIKMSLEKVTFQINACQNRLRKHFGVIGFSVNLMIYWWNDIFCQLANPSEITLLTLSEYWLQWVPQYCTAVCFFGTRIFTFCMSSGWAVNISQ